MSKIELHPVDGGSTIDVPLCKTTIGRGTFLQVIDKRVSRSHATLEIDVDGKLLLTPTILHKTHTNPCFLKTGGDGDPERLAKDTPRHLHHGDVLGLLPNKLFFTVIYKDETHGKMTGVETDAPTVRTTGQQEFCLPCTSNNMEVDSGLESNDNLEPMAAAPLKTARRLPDWMVCQSTKSHTKSPTSPIKNSVSCRKTTQLSSEEDSSCEDGEEDSSCEDGEEIQHHSKQKNVKRKATTVNEDCTESSTTPSAKRIKGSMDNGKSRLLEEDNTELRQQRESADEDDGATAIIHHYESAATSTAGNKSPRPAASTQPAAAEADSDDSDDNDDDSAGTPPVTADDKGSARAKDCKRADDAAKCTAGVRRRACRYAEKCYRKNPAHFAEFCHPGDKSYDEDSASDAEVETTRTLRKKEKRSVLDGASDDDGERNSYNLDDSFLDAADDDDAAAAAVSSSSGEMDESDWQPDDDVDELVTEAKDFKQNTRMQRNT